MRRKDRAAVLLDAEPWDLIVLDEAHHARRRAAGSPQEGGPNALLRLMRDLKTRTQGLVLLTATPMQVHPIEVWDLLDLLGLPPEWTAPAFLDFFEQVNEPSPSAEALDRMARLFQAVEREQAPVSRDAVERLTGLSRLKAGTVLRALRDEASIPRRRTDAAPDERAIALASLRELALFFLSKHRLVEPEIGLSPDGLLLAEWASAERGVLAMKFLPDGIVQFAGVSAAGGAGPRLRVHGELPKDRALDAVQAFVPSVNGPDAPRAAA